MYPWAVGRILIGGRGSGHRTREDRKKRKERAMTAPSITHPIPVRQAMGRSLRMLLAALALVLLVTLAFMVGRLTVSSNTTPAPAPAVHTQAPSSATDTGRLCQVGHLRGPC